MTTISYFCKHHGHDSASRILKAIVLKLVNTNPDLTAVAFTNYVKNYAEPTLKILRTMLKGSPDTQGLLQGASPCRIVIDGLDECEASEQRFIIEDLIQLVSTTEQSNCKLLVCSRDLPEINRALPKKAKHFTSLSLSKEIAFVKDSIRAYAKGKIEELMDDKPSLKDGNGMVDEITEIIVDKSDGLSPLK